MSARGKKARQREERRRTAANRARRRRITIWSAVVVAVIFVLVVAMRPLPEELADVETFPQMGRNHLAQGDAIPEYNSSPATSGDHWPSPADCGIYTSEIPDEIQVHNLEHGVVAIQYQPDLDRSDVQVLENYARTKSSHILVAPRADLDDPVVVTSWTRMLRLPNVDLDTIDVSRGWRAFARSLWTKRCRGSRLIVGSPSI